MSQPYQISGLYAITPDELNTELLLKKVECVLQGGASILQYRNKLAPHKLQTQQARALLSLCRHYHIPLIINDSIKLCLTLDADGVHIGANDGNLNEIRARLGNDKILGASCYNSFDLAIAAQKAEVDYVAFGTCFASQTKPQAKLASLSLFQRAKLELKISSVAIGGITQEYAVQVKEAGADAIAIIQALYSNEDIKKQAQQFSQLYQPTTT